MVGCEGDERCMEKSPGLGLGLGLGLDRNANHVSEPPTPRTPTMVLSNSGKALLVSNSSKSLVMSNSGKKIDKKKYVKQVTGRHNDTELHLAVQRGDLEGVKQILGEIDAQLVGTLSGADFDAEVLDIRAAIVNEVNELGETALFTAAEKGHLDVVKELLQYTSKEAISFKNRSGFDPLHIAARQGHEGNPFRILILLCSLIVCIIVELVCLILFSFIGYESNDVIVKIDDHRSILCL